MQLVDTPDRAAVGHLLKLRESIDLVIPRGGESLIRRVAARRRCRCSSTTGATATSTSTGRPTSTWRSASSSTPSASGPASATRPRACWSTRDVAGRFLPLAAPRCGERGVELRGCERTRADRARREAGDRGGLRGRVSRPDPVGEGGRSLDEAIEHIARYGSGHTEAIVTNDLRAAERFTAVVDSAAVMVNASTRFNDGYEFGLGAEIGISTDKFHARGPCGLQELTSYKYVVYGDGQVRE